MGQIMVCPPLSKRHFFVFKNTCPSVPSKYPTLTLGCLDAGPRSPRCKMRGVRTCPQLGAPHTMNPTYKLPQSVLVVIHTCEMQVLLLRRADMGSWQSVTGSKDHAQESYAHTAAREVAEETGLDVNAPGCVMWDWGLENIYDIYPQYWPRYAPGVRRNTEHVFGLQVPDNSPIVLSPSEHTEYRWLPWLQAADEVFSPSNAKAILMLPRQIALRWGTSQSPAGPT